MLQGGRSVVTLGGGNKRLFQSCRQLLVYNTVTRVWTKRATYGAGPSTIIFHSATPLAHKDDNTDKSSNACTDARYLLVFGGTCQGGDGMGRDTPPQDPDLWLLDALTMRWARPHAVGEVPPSRTRHTIVALESETSAKNRSSYFVRDPRQNSFRDVSSDTNLVLFGGYSPAQREVYSDVYILNVRRKEPTIVQSSTSTSGLQSDNSGVSMSGGGFLANQTAPRPPLRRRNSAASAAQLQEAAAGEDGVNMPPEPPDSMGDAEDPSGYSFMWLRPTVIGTPPAPRLAHTAAMLPLKPERGGGLALMVVFGGVGLGTVFNDTHVVNCSDVGRICWEELALSGTPPGARYGHSMVPVPSQESLLVFGGTSGKHIYSDIHVLTLDHSTHNNVNVHVNAGSPRRFMWTKVSPLGVPPCMRSRQGMTCVGVWTNTEEYTNTSEINMNINTACSNTTILFFGGSDETQDQRPGPQKKRKPRKDLGTRVFELKCSTTATGDDSYVVVNPSGSTNPSANPSSMTWAWSKPLTYMYKPGPEPTVMVPPPSLASDMAELRRCGGFSDVTLTSEVEEHMERPEEQPFAVKSSSSSLSASSLRARNHSTSSETQPNPSSNPKQQMTHNNSSSGSTSKGLMSAPKCRCHLGRFFGLCHHAPPIPSPPSTSVCTTPTNANPSSNPKQMSRWGAPSPMPARAWPLSPSPRFENPEPSTVNFHTNEESNPNPSVGSSTGGLQLVSSSFKAHRFVLAHRSEPLRAMLTGGMKESFSDNVILQDIRGPVFSALLSYLYTDQLCLKAPEDALDLLVIANLYRLEGLVALCEGYLQSVADSENVCALYHYADALHLTDLKHRALTVMLRQWTRVKETESFHSLPPELREEVDKFRVSSSHSFMLDHADSEVVTRLAGPGAERMAPFVYEKLARIASSGGPSKKRGNSTNVNMLTSAHARHHSGNDAEREETDISGYMEEFA